MSQEAETLTGTMTVNESGRFVLKTDLPPQRDPLDTEIEIIKRILHNALDRVEKLRAKKR